MYRPVTRTHALSSPDSDNFVCFFFLPPKKKTGMPRVAITRKTDRSAAFVLSFLWIVDKVVVDNYWISTGYSGGGTPMELNL